MTVQQLIDQLSKIADKDLDVIVIDTRSGDSTLASSVSLATVRGDEDMGELCEMDAGTPYVRLHV